MVQQCTTRPQIILGFSLVFPVTASVYIVWELDTLSSRLFPDNISLSFSLSQLLYTLQCMSPYLDFLYGKGSKNTFLGPFRPTHPWCSPTSGCIVLPGTQRDWTLHMQTTAKSAGNMRTGLNFSCLRLSSVDVRLSSEGMRTNWFVEVGPGTGLSKIVLDWTWQNYS